MRSKLKCSVALFLASGLAMSVLMVACKGGGGKQPSPGTERAPQTNLDFKAMPPAVESATLEAMATPTREGNALLEVKFDGKDARVAKGITMMPHDREVRLVDDGTGGDRKGGDGVFSAIVDFDFDEAQKSNEETIRMLGKAQPRMVFRGREVVGVQNPKAVAERLRGVQLGIRERIGRRISVFDFGSPVDPASIDPERSLVITDPLVIQDPSRTFSICVGAPNGPGSGNPNGVWTFKHLITQMANGVDPAVFAEDWLKLWTATQTVSSGFTASARNNMLNKVLNNWPRVNGKLDLDKSPFRLAAIVNRIDLAENLVYGGGSAGEGRFVFGVFNMETAPTCDMLPFSVIFEYGVKKNGCGGLRSWAKEWIALGNHALGTPAYNAALEAITQQFVAANADPSKPNGSALNQLRTNENGLNPLWQLREFKIDPTTHRLFEDTAKQTPDESLNGGTAVRDFVNANEALIVQDKHVVPDRFPGNTPFMAADSDASSNQLNTHFRANGITNNNARFHFSLNTCTACHIRETRTTFLHIDPKTMPATLSKFMTGNTASISDTPDLFNVQDPVVSATNHSFNDLDRRRQKLADIAGSNCFRSAFVPRELRELIDLRRPIPDGPLPPIDDPRLDGVRDTVRMPH